MKLYPLLFLNEKAKSPQEALSEGVGFIVSKISGTAIVLFDTKKAIENFDEDSNKLEEAGAIVGLIDFVREEIDLYKVNGSAGVLNYGPLAYQIAMQHIGNKNWLMCDNTLKPASEFVWQKMFEFSNKGLYKRDWLGQWGSWYLLPRMEITESAKTDLEEYVKKIEDNKVDYRSEQEFLDWLKEKGLNPEKYGYLWAYNLSSPMDTSELNKKGKEAIAAIRKNNFPKYTVTDIATTIAEAGGKFFSRMYGSDASYLE